METFGNIRGLLAGSTNHQYDHAKISKEDLAKAIGQVTTVVENLSKQVTKQDAEIKKYQQRTEVLEESQEIMALRINSLELALKEAEAQIKGQANEILQDRKFAKETTANLTKVVEKIQPDVEENDTQIQRLLRTADRQQAALQVLKVDVTNATEIANRAVGMSLEESSDDDDDDYDDDVVGASDLVETTTADGQSTTVIPAKRRRGKKKRKLGGGAPGSVSAEQVLCQDFDPSNGDILQELMPISQVIAKLVKEQHRLSTSTGIGGVAELSKALETKAGQGDMERVSTAVLNMSTNMDHLLRSFYDAGIFEYQPPTRSITEAVHETPEYAKYDSEGSETQPQTNQAQKRPGVGDKLAEIRQTYKSVAIGPYGVTQAVRDLRDRFEAEVDAVNEALGGSMERLDEIKAELDTKLDAAMVESKIEVKFDEVIDQLDKAIATAGSDEEEFKKAAKELQETCSMLMASKADQAEILDIRKRLELDGRMSDQVEKLQQYMDEKLNRSEASELISGKVAKEELGVKLSKLHERLRAEMELVIDEKSGARPWMVGKAINPPKCQTSHSNPMEALTCLACNRSVSPGQRELMRRSPLVKSAGSLHKGSRMGDEPHVVPFENDFEDESANLNWGSGMLESGGSTNLKSPHHQNQKIISPHKSAGQPKKPFKHARDKQSTLPMLLQTDKGRVGALRPITPGMAQKQRAVNQVDLPGVEPPVWGSEIRPGSTEARQGPSSIPTSSDGMSQHKQETVVLDDKGNAVISQVRVKTFSF